MPDTAQERTEEATPRKREKARKQGTVARSNDLNGAVVTLALLLVLPSVGVGLGQAFVDVMHRGVGQMPTELSFGRILQHGWSLLWPSIAAFLPLVGTAMFVGIACNFAQVGFVLSPEAIAPKLSKLNPHTGFTRLFSVTASVDAIKATLKMGLFTYIAWHTAASHWDVFLRLGALTPTAALGAAAEIIRQILLRVAIAWLVLAAMDFLFQRKQVSKQLRMTKEELKQEYKEMESSPELKAAMSQRRRKLLKGRMADAVRSADVVVTNPTHFAVAIQYDPAKMFAPQVVAKGQDYLALKIREIAADGKVPIVANPPLARQLYKQCEVGDFVPRELFQAVAEVLAYVYRTIRKMQSVA